MYIYLILWKDIMNSTSTMDWIILIKWVQKIEKRKIVEWILYIYYIDEDGCSSIKAIDEGIARFRNIKIFTK